MDHWVMRPSWEMDTSTSVRSSPDPRSFSIQHSCHTGPVCFPPASLNMPSDNFYNTIAYTQVVPIMVRPIFKHIMLLYLCNYLKATLNVITAFLLKFLKSSIPMHIYLTRQENSIFFTTNYTCI